MVFKKRVLVRPENSRSRKPMKIFMFEYVDSGSIKRRLQVQLLVEIRCFATSLRQNPSIRRHTTLSYIREQYYGQYPLKLE